MEMIYVYKFKIACLNLYIIIIKSAFNKSDLFVNKFKKRPEMRELY